MPAFFNPRIFITKMTIEIRAGFRYNNSIPIHLRQPGRVLPP